MSKKNIFILGNDEEKVSSLKKIMKARFGGNYNFISYGGEDRFSDADGIIYILDSSYCYTFCFDVRSKKHVKSLILSSATELKTVIDLSVNFVNCL